MTRLVALLAVTQDLERNQQDTAFANDPENEIIYCFDQTLIETFLQPADKFRIFEGFHGRTWSEDWGKDRRLWSAVSAQSALIGSKWLFLGRLVGQRNSRIYMSEWHLREFYVRYQKHRVELERELAEDPDGKLQEFLDDAAVLRDDESLTFAAKVARAKRNRGILNLGADLAALSKNRKAAADVEWRFAQSRASAAVLARKGLMQRVQYLHELHDPHFVRRLSPLHTRFQTRTDAEREWVRDRAIDWFDRLHEEQDRRKNDAGAKHKRPARNFKADAATMAYLEWIAETQLNGRERVVFISGGDELLLNAHRRWRIEDPSRPHLLRRAEQYAPMYNFQDSPNDLSRSTEVKPKDLFARTRAAVEVSLAALNLSTVVDDAAKDAVEKVGVDERSIALETARQWLTWLVAYNENPSQAPSLKPFFDAMKPEWVAERTSEFDKLRADWQELERARLGFSYDELRVALDAFHAAHTRFTKLSLQEGRSEESRDTIARTKLGEMPNKAAARAVFTDYVGSLLDEITARSIHIWLPLAVDFVQATSVRKQFIARKKARVPMAVLLRLPAPRKDRGEGKSRYDLVDVIEQWIAAGKKTNREIGAITRWARTAHPPRPDVIFAIAATLALRLGHHNDAGFFAQLALSSLPPDSEDSEENKQEYVYLYALTRRLRLGSRSPQTWNGDGMIWRRELDGIVSDLTASEKHHEAGETPREQLRRVRAISERAAARMFFVTWAIDCAAVAPTRVERSFRKWADDLIAAGADLKSAIGHLDDVLANSELDEPTAYAAQRLSTQLNANWAAIVVLGRLCEEAGLGGGISFDEALTARVLDFLENGFDERAMPPVVKVDILAFRYLQNGDRELLRRIRGVIQGDRDLKLPVDEALFESVSKFIQ